MIQPPMARPSRSPSAPADAARLAQDQLDFTAEGSPVPGSVAGAAPALPASSAAGASTPERSALLGTRPPKRK